MLCLSDAEEAAPAPKPPLTPHQRMLLAEDFQGFHPFEFQGFAVCGEVLEFFVLVGEGVKVRFCGAPDHLVVNLLFLLLQFAQLALDPVFGLPGVALFGFGGAGRGRGGAAARAGDRVAAAGDRGAGKWPRAGVECLVRAPRAERSRRGRRRPG